jgi:chromosome segregation ATPase
MKKKNSCNLLKMENMQMENMQKDNLGIQKIQESITEEFNKHLNSKLIKELKIANLDKEISEVKKELYSSEEKNEILLKQIITMTEEMKELSRVSLIKRWEGEVVKLKGKLEKSNSAKEEAEKENEALKLEIHQSSQVVKLKGELEKSFKLEKELKASQAAERARLGAQMEASEDEVVKLKGELEKSNSAKEETEKENEALKLEKESRASELEASANDVARLEGDLARGGAKVETVLADRGAEGGLSRGGTDKDNVVSNIVEKKLKGESFLIKEQYIYGLVGEKAGKQYKFYKTKK